VPPAAKKKIEAALFRDGTNRRGAMFNFSTIHLFAVAGFAALLASGAQAFDGGSPSGFMNRQVQPVSLPTDVQREVQPTRTIVDDLTGERARTITIDTKNRCLYLSMEGAGRCATMSGSDARALLGPGAPISAATPNGRAGLPPRRDAATPPGIVMEGGLANPLGAPRHVSLRRPRRHHVAYSRHQ
jgi:hypothetical protein